MKTNKYLLFFLIIINPHYTPASTVTVTNLNDSGAGSLRQAIIAVNTSGYESIYFNPSLAGTITLASRLPEITADGVNIVGNLIDGVPTITIDGASTILYGLDINNLNSFSVFTIQNLAIVNCACTAIRVSNCNRLSGSIEISNCYLGTTNGTTKQPNRFGLLLNGDTGSTITVNNCLVYGNSDDGIFINTNSTASVTNSTIYGNTGNGINLEDCTSGTISNNYIGTNLAGDQSNGNSGNGILLEECSSVTVSGNTIAYNTNQGINIASTGSPTSLNSILNNRIFSNVFVPNIVIELDENNNQQPPTLTSATLNADTNTLQVTGTAPSIGDSSDVPLLVQFYVTSGALSTTNPQGQTYVGEITTSALATFEASLTLDISINDSYYVTAIATAKNNSGTNGDSSQFSNAQSIITTSTSSDLFTQRLIEKYATS